MLPVKLLGLLFIFGVSAALGILKAEGLKRRCCKIEEILKSLSRFSELVRVGGYEVDELVALCFDTSVVTVNKGSLSIMEEYLLKEDISLLNDFFKGFGMADREGEYERARLYYSLLEGQHTAAVRSYSELGRLYRSVGLLGGLVLCIFLM